MIPINIRILTYCLLFFNVNAFGDMLEDPEGVDTRCWSLEPEKSAVRCHWVWEQYLALKHVDISQISDKEENKLLISIIKSQSVETLEIIEGDSVWGCFTTFGVYLSEYIRLDVEIDNKTKNFIHGFKIQKLEKLPDKSERAKKFKRDNCALHT